jgi:RNA 2',3'-cyclic 3'-phosphodiesterase
VAPVLAAAAARALARADLHVTLCFLGAVSEAQLAPLCERAGKIDGASFELAFERLEWWRAARVLAATATGVPPAGAQLAAALAGAARQVGLAPDERPWRPHMTLLRGATVPQLAAEPIRLTLPVSRFYLAESQGLGAQACGRAEAPRYATLASWPLRP